MRNRTEHSGCRFCARLQFQEFPRFYNSKTSGVGIVCYQIPRVKKCVFTRFKSNARCASAKILGIQLQFQETFIISILREKMGRRFPGQGKSALIRRGMRRFWVDRKAIYCKLGLSSAAQRGLLSFSHTSPLRGAAETEEGNCRRRWNSTGGEYGELPARPRRLSSSALESQRTRSLVARLPICPLSLDLTRPFSVLPSV